MSAYLSDHFTYIEAIKSSMALRRNIDNTPIDTEITKLKLVATNILEPARMHYQLPFAPSSWFRCLPLNRALRSDDTSQHVKAEAVDFEIPGIDNLELAHWMQHNVDFDQLILEFYDGTDPMSGWVHASFVSSELNRGEILTFRVGGQKAYGLPELPIRSRG